MLLGFRTCSLFEYSILKFSFSFVVSREIRSSRRFLGMRYVWANRGCLLLNSSFGEVESLLLLLPLGSSLP